MNATTFYSSSPETRRPWRYVLAAMILVSLSASVYLTVEVVQNLRQLRSAPHDNIQWTLLQVQSEFGKMQLALEQVHHGESAGSFVKRFDLFYSRIKLLRDGEMFRAVLSRPDISDNFAKIVEFTDETASLIDNQDANRTETRARIWKKINEATDTVQRFTIKSVAIFAEESDRQRENLIRLLRSTALAVLLLVSTLVVGTLIQMSQKRALARREIDLSTSQQVLSATVRSSLDAVIATDSDGRIVEFNPAAEAIFGFAKADVINEPMSDLIIPERFRAAHHAGMRHFLRTGEAKILGQRLELMALHANGTELPVEMSIGCAVGNKGPIFVAFLEDIAQRKKQEDERNEALARAESADAAKSRFLAVMSHEMRTPLNGILGLLDLLDETNLEEEQREFVSTASTSGEILLDLINDVLDLSKLESGKFHLDSERFELRKVITSVEKVVQVELARQHNTIRIDIDPDLPAFLYGDANRVRQIVLNFVSNAVKFTRKGNITITARKIGGDDIRPEIEIAIEDTGIGIPQHRIDQLFEDFTMLDTAYHRRVGGTGLGLAISKRLARAMAGTVGAESSLGEGSRFWFRLRLEQAGNEDTSLLDQAKQQDWDDAAKDHTILLVEDNPTNMMVATGILEKAGARLLLATDGNEAVKAAHAEGIDLILMDISMPEMDGMEATRLIRAIPDERGQVPIVAMTAHAFNEDKVRFMAAGMTDYLPKPIRRKGLLQMIASCLSEEPASMTPAPDTAIEDPADRMPVFDHSVMSILAEETNPELARETARQFVKELETRIADLRDAVARADVTEARKTAHALKGSSSAVGAARLNNVAAKMEEAFIDGQTATAIAMLERLLEEADSAANQLGDYGTKDQKVA